VKLTAGMSRVADVWLSQRGGDGAGDRSGEEGEEWSCGSAVVENWPK